MTAHLKLKKKVIYLEILDEIQRPICKYISSDMASRHDSLSHPRYVASSCVFFYKRTHGNCSEGALHFDTATFRIYTHYYVVS